MPEPEEIAQIIAAEAARADRTTEIEREAQKRARCLLNTGENDVARRRIASAQSTIAEAIAHTQYAMQALRPLELREAEIIASAEQEAGEDSGIAIDGEVGICALRLAGIQDDLENLSAELWKVLNKLS